MIRFLYYIAALLVILWALGFFFQVAGGLVHILLVVAAVLILVRIIFGAGPRG